MNSVTSSIYTLIRNNFSAWPQKSLNSILCELEKIKADAYLFHKLSSTDIKSIEPSYLARRKSNDERIQKQIQETSLIHELFCSSNIVYVMLKGFASSVLIYNNTYRDSCDIDILISPQDMSTVHRLLFSAGWRQEGELSLGEVKGINDYHLNPYYKEQNGETFILEVHLGYHMVPAEKLDKTLDRRLLVKFDTLQFYSLNLEEFLICLCEDLHSDINGNLKNIAKGPKLRGLIDLANFCAKYHKTVDYQYVIDRILHYNLSSEFCTIIDQINSINETSFFEDILQQLRNRNITMSSNTMYGVVTWTHPLTERLFNKELTELDICSWRLSTPAYKENIYCNELAFTNSYINIKDHFMLCVYRNEGAIVIKLRLTQNQLEKFKKHPIQIAFARDPLLMKYFIRLQWKDSGIRVNYSSTFGHRTEGPALHYAALFNMPDAYVGFHPLQIHPIDNNYYELELRYAENFVEDSYASFRESSELYMNIKTFKPSEYDSTNYYIDDEYPPEIGWGKVVVSDAKN